MDEQTVSDLKNFNTLNLKESQVFKGMLVFRDKLVEQGFKPALISDIMTCMALNYNHVSESWFEEAMAELSVLLWKCWESISEEFPVEHGYNPEKIFLTQTANIEL